MFLVRREIFKRQSYILRLHSTKNNNKFTENELKEREDLRSQAQQFNREVGKHFDVQYGTNEVRRAVRVRYAPSPTGDLHIGGLRTALYNYLFAKGHNGKFILRIEDTDKTREVEGSTQRIVDMMKWSGIQWDEGPGSSITEQEGQEGPHGPYIQSQRLPIYQKFIHALLENGDAYHCFCTADRLKRLRVEQGGEKHQATKYDRFCLNLKKEEVEQRIKNGEPYVIRMKVPNGMTEFKDIIHGKVQFNHSIVDDQILIKSDGYPTYHFANVVDDYLMKISHVIRGEEWLSSTPKHIILYKMLSLDPPEFAHLPLLLNERGQKLSKRFGDVSVQSYKDQGFLPEALLNGLALLGWNPPHREDPGILQQPSSVFLKHEVLNMKDLFDLFNIDKIGKSGCKFSQDKLEFLNSMHIRNRFEYFNQLEMKKSVNSWRKMLLDHLDQSLHSAVKKVNESKLIKIMDLMKIRIHFFSDMQNHTYFFTDPIFDTQQARKFLKRLKQPNDIKIKILSELRERLSKVDSSFQAVDINKQCSMYLYENSKDNNYKNEDVFFLLRFAITGNPVGAPIGEICEIIGQKDVIERINDAIDYIKELKPLDLENAENESENLKSSKKAEESE